MEYYENDSNLERVEAYRKLWEGEREKSGGYKLIAVMVGFVCAVFIVLFFLLLLSGCATMNLPKDSTQQEKAAAMCVDAEMGIATAKVAMEGVCTPAQVDYWVRWLDGAQKVRDLYCPKVVGDVGAGSSEAVQ